MKLKVLMMSAATAALMTGAATAQDTATDTEEPMATEAPAEGTTGTAGDMATGGTAAEGDMAAPAAPAFTSLEEMTVGDVLGLDVQSTDGDSIGDIDYVVAQGDGAAAVIGIGGFLGLGEYTVALPLSDFTLNAEEMVLTLGTDKETLKSQPEFDESDAESLPDETPVSSLMASGSDDAAEGSSDGGGDAMESEGSSDGGGDAMESEGSSDGGGDAMESEGSSDGGGDAMESEGSDSETESNG